MENSLMPTGTFFVRACPTCGRNLEVRVELMAREVECVHCGASFIASAESSSIFDDQRIEQILARAQQYIEATMHRRSSDSLDTAPSERL
ncbi:MAG: hypothetical protein D6753_16775 [Planctomycetota bacterium]|nr:MAG: hypothetical protein D6753_16775 [Planctomycetota bacterium]